MSAPLNAEATLSQWQLMRRRFVRHRLAYGSFFIIIMLYLLALLADFMAPYAAGKLHPEYAYCPPQSVRFSPRDGFYTLLMQPHTDKITLRRDYIMRPDVRVPLRLFSRGDEYRLAGLIPLRHRLMGVNLERYQAQQAEAIATGSLPAVPPFFPLGAEKYGRDLLSRILHGARISLSIGLVAIAVSFVLGIIIGGISGYVGGVTDTLIQRFIEIINAFPRLPLWLALAAAVPQHWGPLETYFAITVVLSMLGWTGLARVVRGRILSLREEEYAKAARLLGASHTRILFRHLMPGFTSHIIVSLTMTLPGMILGETGLSFLGLGLRDPVVSWGVMTQDCMNMQTVRAYPWLLLPILFIVLTVLSFNFLGDGLRDAADPYSN